MQLDPAPRTAAGPARLHAELVAQTLLRGPAVARPRQSDLRDLVNLDRLREEESQRRRGALGGCTPLASPADVIRAGERRMEVGSRTFQRCDLRRHAGEQAAGSRRTFRQALHEAHQGSRAGAGRAGDGPAERSAPVGAARPNTDNTNTQLTESQRQKSIHAAPGGREPGPPAGGAAFPAPGASGKPGSAVRQVAQASGRVAPSTAATLFGQSLGLRAAGAAPGPAVGYALGLAASGGGQGAAATAQPSTPQSGVSGTQPAPGTAPPRPLARPAAPAAGPAPRPAAAESADRQADIERIVRLIRTEIGRERSRATLRLDPPELGTIRMHMDLQKDRLFLRVDTQSPVAQRLLTEDVDALRLGLAQSGIHLEKVEIRPPPQRYDLPGDAGTRSQPGEDSSRQDADRSAAERRGSGPQAPAGGRLSFADGAVPGAGEEAQSVAELRLNVWA